MTSLLAATGPTWLTARTTAQTSAPGSAPADLAAPSPSPSPTPMTTSAASATSATSMTSSTSGTTATTAKTPGQSARAALDAQAAAAAKAGTQVVYDLSQPGRVIDMRSLEPEELAAIANGTGAAFSHDEKIWAQGELNHRVAVTLEGLDSGDPGDSRAYQMGVRALYVQMSPAVRQAMGWTPQMLATADRIIETDERRHGKPPPRSHRHRWPATDHPCQQRPGSLQLANPEVRAERVRARRSVADLTVVVGAHRRGTTAEANTSA